MEINKTALLLDIVLISTSVLVILFSLFYLYMKNQFKYWEKRGIPGPKPELIFGNMKDLFTLKGTEPEVVYNYSTQFEKEKYYGLFHLWKPMIVIKDLELSKKVLEKNFEYFGDHPQIVGECKSDKIFDSLFTMNGNRWKSRRHVFSKLFTPIKLREYAQDIRIVLENLIEYITDHIKTGEDFEMQDALEPFALYSLTSAMFGIDLRQDKDRTEKLIHSSTFLLHPPPLNVVKFVGYSVHPNILRFFNVSTMPAYHWDECSSFATQVADSRKHLVHKRNDLFTMLNQLRNEDILQDGSKYKIFMCFIAHLYLIRETF